MSADAAGLLFQKAQQTLDEIKGQIRSIMTRFPPDINGFSYQRAVSFKQACLDANKCLGFKADTDASASRAKNALMNLQEFYK